MAVAIKPKSTQHTGLAQSMEGSVAAWLVTFQLDEGDSIHATISIPLTGPPSHHEAQEKALKMLRVFLNDACDAANKFRFSNQGIIPRRVDTYDGPESLWHVLESV